MQPNVPVIGPSRATARVIYAFRHGHLGQTESAGNARLVADLLEGRPLPLDRTPLSAQRF